MKQLCLMVFLVMVIAACTKIDDIEPNTVNKRNLPNDWKQRTLLNRTALYKYDIAELVGLALVTVDNTGDMGVFTITDGMNKHYCIPEKRYLSTAPVIKLEKGDIYNFKISVDVGVKADVSYYVDFAEDLQTGVVRKGQLQDVAYVFSKSDQYRDDALKDLVAAVPGRKVYIIKGVLLSEAHLEDYYKVESKTTIQGEAFGFNGDVYVKTESNMTKRDFFIHLEIVPVESVLGFSKSVDTLFQGHRVKVADDVLEKLLSPEA